MPLFTNFVPRRILGLLVLSLGLLIQSAWATATEAEITPSISIVPAAVNFGTVAVGTVTANQVVTISNNGTSLLNLSNALAVGGLSKDEFDISVNNCPLSLSPGASCTLQVFFHPSSAGAKQSTIAVNSNDPVAGSLHLVLNGVALEGGGGGVGGVGSAAIGVSSRVIDFGVIAVGQSTPVQNLVIQSTGTSPLNVTGFSFDGVSPEDFFVLSNGCGINVPISGSCIVQLFMKPTAPGAKAAIFKINSNSLIEPTLVVLLTGIASGIVDGGPPPIGGTAGFDVTPLDLDFGNVNVGVPTDIKSVTISSIGLGAVQLTSMTIKGANPNQFFIFSNSCPPELAPGTSCEVEIFMQPNSEGAKEAVFEIQTNDLVKPIVLVNLTGVSGSATGGGGLGGGTQGLPVLNVTPLMLNYPTTFPGNTSENQSVSVSNSGDVVLNITNTVVEGHTPGEFSIFSNSCPTQLLPGGSCEINVFFRPSSPGAKQSVLRINSDDPVRPTILVLLNGNSSLSIVPFKVDFGAVTVGAGAMITRLVKVENLGTAPLSVADLQITGPDAAAFQIVSHTCNATLSVGAFCTVEVGFQADTGGEKTATLLVSSDDPNVDDVTVALSASLDASVSVEDTELPKDWALAQNYPNPFNPETQIRFAVPEASEVRLAVYDLLGREVANLVEGIVQAGVHLVRFDARTLPSGTYLYRLETPTKTLVGKMLLMK